MPPALVRRLHELAEGDFLDEATNVLAFGLPGVGKSHAMCAVGHALVDRGHAVLFMPTYSLVQELLAAKRNLELPRALRKLDQFAVLILDDVGYIQQSPEEAEILFTLLAERYERRSVFITSNLIFAHWDRIFRDQMATAAAIDRLVHHSVLLEFDVPSFRTEHAKRRGKAAASPRTEPDRMNRAPTDRRVIRTAGFQALAGACAPAGAPALTSFTATNRPTTTTEHRPVVGDSLLIP